MSDSQAKPEFPVSPSLPSGGKRIDLRLLSEHLGLSRATISLVLNNAPLAQRLSAETRERVIKAAESLGYRPNYFARSLGGKRTHLIGIIAPDFGHGYDSAVLSGAERWLMESEYVYFVSSHLWSPALLTRSVNMLLDRGAEGLLLVNTVRTAPTGVPTVTIGAGTPSPGGALLHIDNAHGVRLALEHLVGLGHQRIAFVKGHQGSLDTEERWAAIKRTCKRLGIAFDEELTVQLERIGLTGNYGIEEGYNAAQQLLTRKRPFTALFAFNDHSAVGAMHALRDAGRSVPSDVSVVGFDDIDVASVTWPPLTSVHQPLREMGERAAQIILQQIESPETPSPNVKVKPELVCRSSTATAPKQRVAKKRAAKGAA